MKFKQIPKDYFATILDRLTRFEPAYIRYKRVFDDIVNKFSISDKLKTMNFADEVNFVSEIINSSVQNEDFTPVLNNVLMDLENKYFNFNEESYQYLSNRINFLGLIEEIEINQNSPKNLVWLKKIQEENYVNIVELREKYSLLYPIEKIILCEGQTEYTLLNTLFNLFDYDLDKKGVLVLQAGGKNQVARKYYHMLEYTKIPFFILLDKDAKPTKDLIDSKLRPIDKVYLINSGEFEDLIPLNILQKTVNYIHRNELNCTFEDFSNEKTMVENLHDIYKKYGFGEYKKAQFANELNEYIAKNCSKKDFLDSEIVQIIDYFK